MSNNRLQYTQSQTRDSTFRFIDSYSISSLRLLASITRGGYHLTLAFVEISCFGFWWNLPGRSHKGSRALTLSC